MPGGLEVRLVDVALLVGAGHLPRLADQPRLHRAILAVGVVTLGLQRGRHSPLALVLLEEDAAGLLVVRLPEGRPAASVGLPQEEAADARLVDARDQKGLSGSAAVAHRQRLLESLSEGQRPTHWPRRLRRGRGGRRRRCGCGGVGGGGCLRRSRLATCLSRRAVLRRRGPGGDSSGGCRLRLARLGLGLAGAVGGGDACPWAAGDPRAHGFPRVVRRAARADRDDQVLGAAMADLHPPFVGQRELPAQLPLLRALLLLRGELLPRAPADLRHLVCPVARGILQRRPDLDIALPEVDELAHGRGPLAVPDLIFVGVLREHEVLLGGRGGWGIRPTPTGPGPTKMYLGTLL